MAQSYINSSILAQNTRKKVIPHNALIQYAEKNSLSEAFAHLKAVNILCPG